MTPRISVYIASHDYGRFLKEAIESVLRQTVDDWELLLIDDGSTDETDAVLEVYRGHPKIRSFRTEGLGLPAVGNMALREARGRYLIRLDGDDRFDENILLILGHYLDRNETLAMAFPDYYLMEESGEVIGLERRQSLYTEDHLMDVPANGACALIRCDLLRRLGGYREDLGAQDGLDLWARMKNEKKANVNLPLFFYRRHRNNLTNQVVKVSNARRQIKKDVALETLGSVGPIVAVIPCRKYYDFVDDLWNIELDGRTLLERDIDACLATPLIDHIVVACDNPSANSVVQQYSDPRVRFFLRSEKSTLRSANIVSTLEEVVAGIDRAFGGITVVRYVQTPFVSTGTIEEALTTLEYSGADSAIAVEEIRSQMFRRSSFGLTSLGGTLGREDGLFYRDSSTCMALRHGNLRTGSLLGSRVASFVVSAAESFFISDAHDLEVARALTYPRQGD